MSDKEVLYDPEILEKFYLGERFNILKDDDTLCLRPLRLSDYDRGFLDLLKELTEVGNVSREMFEGGECMWLSSCPLIILFNFAEQFKFMKNSHGSYYCTVIVDTSIDRIVGAATLLMERKFIRGCALVN